MNEQADTAPVRMVRCPACQGPSPYTPDNPFRPFCSPRCKQHDLGAWASESFKLPATDTEDPHNPT